MKRITFFSAVTFSLMLVCELFAQSIPGTINYQGVLKDGSGIIVANGDYDFIFRIYNIESGGSALWTETKLVSITDGIFATQLGNITPINLPFDAAYWLGISISGGSEMMPRIPFTSVPYSRISFTVPDNSLTAGKISSGQVVKSLNSLKDNISLIAGTNITITPTGNDLTISATGGGGGTVTQINTGAGLTGGPITTTGTISVDNSGITNTMLQNNAVTSTKILDGTITAGDIGSTQVVKSLNSIEDNVNLVGGTNITITPSGQEITISSTAGGMGGSGTVNYLPRFTAATTLGNSAIYQSGNNIGIGTTTPSAKFTLEGGDALINGLTVGQGGIAGQLWNSAFGYQALYSNTLGSDNTANGYRSLYSNTSGIDNTANGYRSLYSNTIGSYNTAIGNQALYSNTLGIDNTANGSSALYSNTEGDYNTANGSGALYSNTIGYKNTANGFGALYHNTDGYENTASGYQALYSNTTGDINTAIGLRALYYNTSGYDNTANGYEALYSNTTGNYNTANGVYALYYNTTGDDNTGIGFSAGDYYTFSQGTFLGSSAYPNANGYSNITGLGYNARPTATNQVRIGNSSVTSIGGYAGWTNFSDGRYKTSIQENVSGLDFIMKLRPITYQLDINRLSADLKEDQRRDENGNIVNSPDENDIKSRNEKSQIVYTGFVAQEVEKTAIEVGFNFSGIDKPKNENDFYGLRYAEFVVPLVKAVQEQQKIIEELTRRIEYLENK